MTCELTPKQVKALPTAALRVIQSDLRKNRTGRRQASPGLPALTGVGRSRIETEGEVIHARKQ